MIGVEVEEMMVEKEEEVEKVVHQLLFGDWQEVIKANNALSLIINIC